MIDISDALKTAFNPGDGEGGRQVDYSVQFEFAAEEAQAEAVPAAAEDIPISRLAQVTDYRAEPLDWISFEPGGWPLDGSKVIPPRTGELPDAHIGLVMPDLSDENGVFAAEQTLTLQTASSYNIVGVTVDFGHAPAADFEVRYYNGAALLKTVAVTDNSKRLYLVAQAVENVNRIVLAITKSALPRHRARVSGFLYGALIVYDKSNSESLSLTEEIDPTNARVPAGTLKIVANNFAGDFNIFDPAGIYAFFRERQVFRPRIGALTASGSWEYVEKGRYYLQRPKLSGNLSKLELSAVDVLGVLTDTTYSTGVYKTATLAQLAGDVAADAGVPVSCPDSLNAVTVSACIPTVTHAEAFRRIAQASNTILRAGPDGGVVFLEPGQAALQTLTKNDYRAENGFVPSDDDIINTVAVEVYSYTVSPAAEQLAVASGAGTHYLVYDLSTEQAVSVSGGALVSAVFHADNAVVTITGGTVTVTGKKLTAAKKIVTVTTAQPNDRKYVYEVKGNPLIQPSNAGAVAEYTLNMKAVKRKTVKIEYRGYPYLETGDVINFNTGGQNTPPHIITRNVLKLAGGMAGTLVSRER